MNMVLIIGPFAVSCWKILFEIMKDFGELSVGVLTWMLIVILGVILQKCVFVSSQDRFLARSQSAEDDDEFVRSSLAIVSHDPKLSASPQEIRATPQKVPLVVT